MFSLHMVQGNWEGLTTPLEVQKTVTKIKLFCLEGWNIGGYTEAKIKWIQNDS